MPSPNSPLVRDLKELTSVAAPAVALQVGLMMLGVVDTMVVSRLGTDSLAAASLGSSWIWATIVFGMGVVFGVDPLITQAHGAGDGRRLGLALHRGLAVALISSVPVMIAWALTARGLVLLGENPALAREAWRFTAVQIPSAAPFLLFWALRQYLIGRGIVAPAVVVVLIANVVNLALNWMLVFGHLGAPALGLVGSGISTALTRVLMLSLLVLWVRIRGLHRGAWVPWSAESVSPLAIASTLRLGLPIGLQYGLETWAFQAAGLMAGWLGTRELGAHSIVMNLASLSFMLPLGISMAAVTLVGSRIGAGDVEGAHRGAKVSLAAGAAAMSLSAFAFLIFRRGLPLLYGPTAEVAALASGLLPIAAAFQLFDGTQVVGGGVLRGMGLTRPAAVINLIGYYALALPLAWWLAFRAGAGLAGIWWGLALGLFAIATMLVLWIARSTPRQVALDGSEIKTLSG